MTPKFEPDTMSYMGSISAHMMTGQFDEAISELNEVIKLEPNNGSAYAVRGEAYRMKKQYDAAISDFSEAIK